MMEAVGVGRRRRVLVLVRLCHHRAGTHVSADRLLLLLLQCDLKVLTPRAGRSPIISSRLRSIFDVVKVTGDVEVQCDKVSRVVKCRWLHPEDLLACLLQLRRARTLCRCPSSSFTNNNQCTVTQHQVLIMTYNRNCLAAQPYDWPHPPSELSRKTTALVIIDMQRDCTKAQDHFRSTIV